MWKVLNGYFWPYRVNEDARVERQLDCGRWRVVTPFLDKLNRRYMVHVKGADGRRRNVPLKHLVAEAFMPGYHPGIPIGFRNEMVTDCSLCNLYITSQKENGHRNGGNGRKAVEKIDRNGAVVNIYASISEAAKKNFISRKSVYYRCTGQMKQHDPFAALGGYSFRYER